MKKTLLLLSFFAAILSCKNDAKTETKDSDLNTTVDNNGRTEKQSDGLTLLKGEFVYYADAAVLQTHREVYGVVIDDKMHELNKQVEAFKNEATDMVPVAIRGKIIPKPENEEGWPYRVEIKEILEVVKPSSESNDVIKLQ